MAQEPGKSVRGQIEGNHAYRDEPPSIDPREGVDPELRAFMDSLESTSDAPSSYIDDAGRVVVEATSVGPNLARVAARHEVSLSPQLTDFGCECCGSYVDSFTVNRA